MRDSYIWRHRRQSLKHNILKISACLSAALLMNAQTACADLIGDDVDFIHTFGGFVQGQQLDTTVLAGPTEYVDGIAGGQFNINVEANQITFSVSGGTPGNSVSFGGPLQIYTIGDLDWIGQPSIITGVNVQTQGITGLLPNAVTFTDNSISLDVSSSSWEYNLGLITVDLTTSQVVPEPGSLALFGCGLAGLGLLVRRRHSRVA